MNYVILTMDERDERVHVIPFANTRFMSADAPTACGLAIPLGSRAGVRGPRKLDKLCPDCFEALHQARLQRMVNGEDA